ncbi:hypothetical protein AQ611_19065 [Burkholderia singularis]|nr:hypothetical protein AQ611_19065 [Burkholderia sp. Bp7605]
MPSAHHENLHDGNCRAQGWRNSSAMLRGSGIGGEVPRLRWLIDIPPSAPPTGATVAHRTGWAARVH